MESTKQAEYRFVCELEILQVSENLHETQMHTMRSANLYRIQEFRLACRSQILLEAPEQRIVLMDGTFKSSEDLFREAMIFGFDDAENLPLALVPDLIGVPE